MYQYIAALNSGITKFCHMLRGDGLKGRTTSKVEEKNCMYNSGYFSVILLGMACTVCLLLFFISVELVSGYFPDSATGCVGIITALGAVVLSGMLIKYELLTRKYSAEAADSRNLRRENRVLQQRVSDLVTHSAIAKAAASSMTFGCFIGSVARMLRKNRSARELTIFTNIEGRILPHTYYQFSDYSELCLSLSRTELEKSMAGSAAFDNKELSAENLALEYTEGNITIEGDLLYYAAAVGRLRITLFDCSEKIYSFKDLLEGMVQNALASVCICFDGAFQGLGYIRPTLTEVSNSAGILLQRLEVEENVLGVVRLVFQKNSNSSVKSMKNILQNAAGHISKALYNQRLYELAVKDGLTGLYNKRYLLEVLETNCRSCISGVERLTFMLLDIDFFKKVNDTWGHLVGDKVLRRVAEIVAGNARNADIACRYGGEELAVLMPDTDIDGARILAERIRLKIEREVFSASEGETFSVTASFGVAEMHSGMIMAEELVEQADKALYKAKNNGRNRVVVHKPVSSDFIAA